MFKKVLAIGSALMTLSVGATAAMDHGVPPPKPMKSNEGFFASADVLYKVARLEDTNYAYTNNNPYKDSSQIIFPVIGESKSTDFDWKWGFRVGAGYQFGCEGSDAQMVYSWFKTNGKSDATAPAEGNLIPVRVHAYGGKGHYLVAGEAHAENNMKHQDLAFQLGHENRINKKISLRSYYGPKIAWLDQSNIRWYTGGDTALDSGLGKEVATIKDTCNLFGVGPQAGLQSKWDLGRGFSVSNHFGASLLLSHFDMKHTVDVTDKDGGDDSTSVDGTHDGVTPLIQMGLKFCYEQGFKANTQRLNASLGFEADHWFNANRATFEETLTLRYNRMDQSLTTYGFTFNLCWEC